MKEQIYEEINSQVVDAFCKQSFNDVHAKMNKAIGEKVKFDVEMKFMGFSLENNLTIVDYIEERVYQSLVKIS